MSVFFKPNSIIFKKYVYNLCRKNYFFVYLILDKKKLIGNIAIFFLSSQMKRMFMVSANALHNLSKEILIQTTNKITEKKAFLNYKTTLFNC